RKGSCQKKTSLQKNFLAGGEKRKKNARLWNIDRGETAVMRSKEEAHDYRYFPDPDLVPLRITTEWVDQVRSTLSELPAERRNRLEREYGLSEYSAGVLASDKKFLDYFEECVAEAEKLGYSKLEVGKELANCITVDFRGLSRRGVAITPPNPSLFDRDPYQDAIGPLAISIPAKNLVGLVDKKMKGEISGPTYKAVLEEMFNTRKTAAEIIEANGLRQVSDEGEIQRIIDEVLGKHPTQVAQFKEGKQQVLGFLVGQVMKASSGKA